MNTIARSGKAGSRFPAVVGLGWIVLAPLVVAACLRLLRLDDNVPMVAVNGLTLWAYLPAYVVAVLALVGRSRPLLVVALAVVAAHLVWVAPWPGGRVSVAEGRGAPLRLVTSNVLMDNPRPDDMASRLLALDADVLFLQELQDVHVTALEAAGVARKYPHAVVRTRDDQFGTAIYSRLPLEDVQVADLVGSVALEAAVRVDGRPVELRNVHLKAPATEAGLREWTAQLAALDDRIDDLAGAGGAVVVAGDFNATRHHRQFRALLDGGIRDAHQAVGRALARTWPNHMSGMPTLMHLDHVLVSPQVAVRSVAETEIPGSDHLAVVAELLVGEEEPRPHPPAVTSR